MAEELRLMCIFAHPDDESLGTGGTLAKYAAEGVVTYLVTATRGEHGWPSHASAYPGPKTLGQIREAELRAAAGVLGLHGLEFLNYIDGELDQADPAEVIAELVRHLRRVRPQVVITFGPDGVTGHPDHVAISQFTTAAVVCAADPSYPEAGEGDLHRVLKLYYMAPSKEKLAVYQAAFSDLVLHIDGMERRACAWEDWAITTRIDTAAYWQQVWEAVTCHRTQLPGYQTLAQLPDEHHQRLWGTQEYYRVFSLVNGGRAVEHDLFAGLR